MSNNENNQEQQLLIKQLVRDYLEENIEGVKNEDLKKDNSFVFLENKTLHMMITFMLTHLNNHPSPDVRKVGAESSVLEEISPYLDAMIEDNKLAFEEVITILKEN
ncbi:hypothetical protein [Oceanobacillus sp. CF4.6]|uniref:hypothetical protein n=1 Tax=Oceanobacillus sp. CF4.6 TaxID=3373080 RepID=UPI003EE4ABFE